MFPRLGPDTITKLFALPLRLAYAWGKGPDPQGVLALLEGVKKNASLEVIRIDSFRLQWNWDFIQACKQKPRLKELWTRQFAFEARAGDGLCCTRLSLEPSEAVQVLSLLKNELGSLRELQLLHEQGWNRAEIPVFDWSAFSSLECLSVDGSEDAVFPWGCLSLPRLSTLHFSLRDGIIDMTMPQGTLLRPSQLKILTLSGKTADFSEILSLLRCCPALERVHLDCRSGYRGAIGTARMLIEALELPVLKALSIEVRYEAMRQHLLAKLDLKALRPQVEIQFLWGEDKEVAEPEDLAQAIEQINLYYASKIAPKQL